MKAWVLHGVNDFRFEEVKRPVPEEGEVLVKVMACGICGSDVPRIYEPGAHVMPLIPGHEFSGIVEEVGESVSAEWIGKCVGVFPLIPCRSCAPCRSGRYELCRNYTYIGSRRDGAFAEYVTVPAANLIGLPGDITFEESAMLEPLAVCIHALRKGTEELTLNRNEQVAVCGIGTIGFLLTALLSGAGFRNIIAIGNKDFQREKIKEAGLEGVRFYNSRETDVSKCLQEEGNGAALYFECTGKTECATWGIEGAAPYGKVVLVGNPRKDMAMDKNTYWKILRNELTITGTWNASFDGTGEDDWHTAIECIQKHCIRPADIITHRLPLAELGITLRMMRDKKETYGKIMVMLD